MTLVVDGVAQGPEWDAAFEDYRREQARSGECWLLFTLNEMRVVPTLVSLKEDAIEYRAYRCWRPDPRYGVLALAPEAPSAEDFERWFAEDIRDTLIFGRGSQVSYASTLVG